ncbi:MAG: CHAP domain-containing protein [Candidatus Contendobacter sp.]|nr:CHAP domain-containing protein [Candidatus Contendobacter sp.]MDG4559125.1 CHAP domain-containing protein [Candidatus Contendobacter sp.]
MKTNQLLMSSALILNFCLSGAAFSQSMEEDSQPVEESSDSAMLLGNMVDHRSGVTDTDEKPYEIYQIMSITGIRSWFDNNFNTDATLPVHYLSETVQEVTTLEGKPALAFKTSEYEKLMQNLLVDDSESQLVLYRIVAEDSSKLLMQMLGFIPAETPSVDTGRRAIQANRQPTAAANPPASCQNNKYRFGAITGTYNGVPAYSNCQSIYVSDQPSSYSGYTTGWKWQCVEYVARYFKAIFNKKIAGGDANSYCARASEKGLKKSDNGKTSDKPQPGNVICSNGGKHGHCAIIRAVGSDYVEVIEQNFNNSSSDANHRLSLKKIDGKYKVGDFSKSHPVACWMWPK